MAHVHAAKDRKVLGGSGSRQRMTWCGILAPVTQVSTKPTERTLTCPECRRRLEAAGIYVPGL